MYLCGSPSLALLFQVLLILFFIHEVIELSYIIHIETGYPAAVHRVFIYEARLVFERLIHLGDRSANRREYVCSRFDRFGNCQVIALANVSPTTGKST